MTPITFYLTAPENLRDSNTSWTADLMMTCDANERRIMAVTAHNVHHNDARDAIAQGAMDILATAVQHQFNWHPEDTYDPDY